VNNKPWHQRRSTRLSMFLITVLILVLIALQFGPVRAAGKTPGFMPPKPHPYGKSLDEWGVEWARYIISLPEDINPLNDATGANCGVQQSGPVFFLVGTTGGDPIIRDECVVPVGTALFFPILSIFGAVPEDGATPEEVAELVASVFAGGENVDLESLSVTVDGVSLANPENYFLVPPAFSFTGHEENIFQDSCGGVDPGECYVGYHETGFLEGYWVLLHPLPPGTHQITIYGEVYVPEWDWGWTVDVTYNLTIVNRG
jgi:hypothetical protein